MVKVIFTIDVEIGDGGQQYYYGADAFEKIVLGKIGEQEVGVRFIMAKLQEYDYSGDFFIDACSYKKHEESQYCQLANEILERNHQLQLHTHPLVLYKTRFMHELTHPEQKAMVHFGINKIREWTNTIPIAHRAGSYSANNETMAILQECGIYYDLSYFHNHRNCRLKVDTINSIVRINNVLEIPVTVFQITKKFMVFRRDKFVKCDLEHLGSAAVVYSKIKLFKDNDIVVLFLHSFSFLKLAFDKQEKEYTIIEVNTELVKEFDKLLQMIKQDDSLEVTRIKDIQHEQKVSVPKCQQKITAKQVLSKII